MAAECSAPPSEPANRAFLRISLIGRIERPTVLLSSSIRPASGTAFGPFHRDRASRDGAGELPFWLPKVSFALSHCSIIGERPAFLLPDETALLGAATADVPELSDAL
jgi:hypothetical protein